MRNKVITIIEILLAENNIFLNNKISENQKFEELGMSSFDMAILADRIEEEFKVNVFEEGVVYTVGEIIAILNKKNNL